VRLVGWVIINLDLILLCILKWYVYEIVVNTTIISKKENLEMNKITHLS